MARVIVLGGCGAVGRVAVKTLAEQDDFSEVVIGELDPERGSALAAELGPKVTACGVDALDRDSLRRAIAGADIVLNCVGPFYRTVKPIIDTVIDAGIDYVDICDDVDVTLELLDRSERAEQAGVTALIGMGGSPGATNLLATLAAQTLLDETSAVDIFHVHGGEPFEGPGVIGHRFHCMSIDIPMYLDGRLQHFKFFDESGIALRETFEFPVIDEEVLLYPYPHPEQVTLPRTLDVDRVTNKGSVLPAAYYELTRDVCALGLADKEPLDVQGQSVVPYDFALAFIIRERDRILREGKFGPQRGCTSVLVKGKKDGEDLEYRFHIASRSHALGEGTGVPAALGTLLMQRGRITRKGILPPEACVDPQEFVQLFRDVLRDSGISGTPEGAIVFAERIDASGNVETVDF
jgi:saccharopine dehydrogenase (NAD+, L-lysine-forming)